jgi:NADPH:quinone reductase-like Zn-dependent oxidoreductase
MRVAEYSAYGSADVVHVAERQRPVPAEGEVLVRVVAAAVTAADVAARSGRPLFSRLFFGLRRPKWPVLGSDFSGEIVELGPGVTDLAVGDEVWGASGPNFGAHAEFVVVAASGAIALKPTTYSHVDAAAVLYGALTALPFLRDGAQLRAGQRILVNGASGGVGTAAVMIAKHFEAEVTAVCSGRSADLVRSLGADQVIDYGVDDFTDSGERWDVVFDVAGRSSFSRSRRVLSPSGIYLSTVPSAGVLLASIVARGRAKIMFTGLLPVAAVRGDLAQLERLAASGELLPVLDHAFPLAAIAEAHSRVEHGPKSGNVVLVM